MMKDIFWNLEDQDGIEDDNDCGPLLGKDVHMGIELQHPSLQNNLDEYNWESCSHDLYPNSDIEPTQSKTLEPLQDMGLLGLSETFQDKVAVVLFGDSDESQQPCVPLPHRRKEKLQPRADVIRLPSTNLLKSKPPKKNSKQFLYNLDPNQAKDAAEARRVKKAIDTHQFHKGRKDAIKNLKDENAKLRRENAELTHKLAQFHQTHSNICG